MDLFENNNKTLENLLIDLPEKRDTRGALCFVQHSDFDFSRAFWIYDVPKNAERGNHAHLTCSELLIAVKGSLDVELYDGKSRMVFHLDTPNKGLVIRPMVWCRLYNFSEDFVGLCLASQDYSPMGYIHSLAEFEEALRK